MSKPRNGSVSITGRILYLTQDSELLRRQLAGERLLYDPDRPLIDNISTDELTPGWVCYYYDETLARYCLVGLRGGAVERDAVHNGGFQVKRAKYRPSDLDRPFPDPPHRAR
jgi:3-isopropylmalate/(R)-2-methylmalate dehydratase large subunit